jgi:two-component system LytT family response regulator
MIEAVVVDDERKGRELLVKILQTYCNDIEVVGQAETANQAYEVISATKPKLVFLDIEMPNGTGFDLLKMFAKIEFDIIFTTAYDHYAIKAIKYAAIDYLLKPIDIDELQEAVFKVQSKVNQETKGQPENIEVLLSALTNANLVKKIAIPDQEGVAIVEISDIIRCQADSNYTLIFLKDGSKLVSTKTLKEYNNLLDEAVFKRVHNSFLININHIKKYIKGDGGQVVMSDDSIVEVSRRRKNDLLDALTR